MQQIDSRGNALRQDRRHVYGEPVEGAEFVGFYDGGALVKLTASYAAESGRTAMTIYYWPDTTIALVRRVTDVYVQPLPMRISPRVASSEEVEVLSDGTSPLQTRKGRIVIWKTSPDVERDAAAVLSDARRTLSEYRTAARDS